MAMMSSSAKELAAMGADIVITADAGYMTSSVKEIIQVAARAGGHVTVHAGKYMTSSLKEMIRAGNGNVTIVI
ncbi:hypothetical protein [Massilia timonae]|uniref:hypothetical protein n=2 Tax=Massilia TaxID=149698 RepID=UPI0028998933|nr:hypothetical protein [Massilia timonae]